LQRLNYGKNEVGHQTIESLRKLLTMDHFDCDDPTFHEETYSLKELSFQDVHIRVGDLRKLTDMLCGSGKNLQQLSLKDVQLHDREALTSLCDYISCSRNLRHLALVRCNLGVSRCRLEATDAKQESNVGSGLVKVFESIADCRLIQTVDLGDNRITRSLPDLEGTLMAICEHITGLIKRLEQLDVSGMHLTSLLADAIISELPSASVSYLNLRDNLLNPMDIALIKKTLNIPERPVALELLMQND
jgi:Leucine-rich repeat (LRR) protein